MSCQAVAAALALSDLSCGQRLVAFSLASFADRDSRARPGTAAGAARSGLSKSRYLQAREQLVSRGLVVVEDAASGRGRASTLALPFAQAGPWWDGDVNADLFEAVLGYSRTEGPARLLLAVLASNADADGITSDLTTLRVCEAAGLSDRTYRRARKILLASEELVVLSAAGGRGNTNRWRVPDPCQLGAGPPRVVPRRVPVPQGVRPLLAQVIERPPIPPLDAQPAASAKPFVGVPSSPVVGKGGQDRTVLASNRPNVTGVPAVKGGQDQTLPAQNCPNVTEVSAVKGGQDQTLFADDRRETPAQTPAETPAETPAPNARAGTEPQNPRTPEHPPDPPGGGRRGDRAVIEETYVTERGRSRRRPVVVNLDEVRRGLAPPSGSDRRDWKQISELLAVRVGESTFAIWLSQVELIAVDGTGVLLLIAPAATREWVRSRFGRLITDCTRHVGREWRFATATERAALGNGRAGSAALTERIETKDEEVS